MKNIRAARRYATAFLDVAEERHVVDEVAKDLEMVGATLRASRDLRLLMASPVISGARKQAALRELFGKRTGGELQLFIDLLIRKQRETLLPEIVDAFLILRDERAGIVNAEVTTAVQITAAQEEALKHALGLYTGKVVRVRLMCDAALRGGLVAKIGDRVLDGCVRHQLEKLHRRFVEGVARQHRA